MSSSSSSSLWRDQSPYASEFCEDAVTETGLKKIWSASCFCGRVQYQVRGMPESAKLCHCRACQVLHGAPFEWVAIFHKHNVRIPSSTSSSSSSLNYLYWYNSELDKGYSIDVAQDRVLPCKVSCTHCRTPIADEGRHMWLAYCTLFGFTIEESGGIPDAFQHSCHLFYGQRCINLENDQQPKWTGHIAKSAPWKKKG